MLSISKHIPSLVEEDPVDGRPGGGQEDSGNSNRPLLNGLNGNDGHTTLSRTRNGSGHGDQARSTASGPASGHEHPS